MAYRVLHLLSQKPGWTGSGMALNAIVQAAQCAGWQQAVVIGTSPDEPVPAVGGLRPDQIRPLVFESAALSYPLPGMSDVMPYASTRFSDMSAAQLTAYCDAWRGRIAAAIEEFRPDIIHSHHLWLLSSLVRDVTPAIPVVTHCHGTGLRQLALCPEIAPQVRSGCSRNDAFLLLHQGHAGELLEQFDVAASQLSIIGSGFREDIFHADGRPESCGPVITYAGKLSAAKGVPWLLDATAELADRMPDLILNIAGAGSGAEADAIRSRIDGARHVVFHGQLDPKHLADLLRRTAVFVLPSFFEGLPLVLIEAAACGCRLVATALPGVVNQLQPVLGSSLELVTLPRLQNTDQPVKSDLPEFVRQLSQAIEVSLGRRDQVADRGGVDGMTWGSVFQKIEAIWRRLINERESSKRLP